MEIEKKLIDYISRTRFEDLPPEPLGVVKKMLLADIGTTLAGSEAEGCQALVDFYKDQGGSEEATVLIHGGKIPAANAALINSVMSRALDFCDAIAPGPHIGSSAIPSALASSELMGGCSGKDFITAVVLGTETAARLNLTESAYDGFDPTGICVTFAATVAAGKILRLGFEQIWNALGLAFNRCGGSFQSHIDGSLGVRVNQGWVSHAGVSSTQLARIGITGPKNFLSGIYGYYHLYGKDMLSPQTILEGLGEQFELENVMFKKYPSCAATAGGTEAILDIIQENNFYPQDIRAIKIAMPPYAYQLVGHDFQIGNNPTVNAQFSIQYCVANALLRRSSKLRHFQEASVRDSKIMKLVPKISVEKDVELEKRGHTALDMHVISSEGQEFSKAVTIAPGFPGNPLTQEEHLMRFWDCVDFANQPISSKKAKEILAVIDNIEEVENIYDLIHLLGSSESQ